MNNILKFHQNPLTINACHIKIKFKLKLGWGFSQRGMDQSQMWSTAHTAACGRKALINNCTYNFGQNKSGKCEHFSDTQPCPTYAAIFWCVYRTAKSAIIVSTRIRTQDLHVRRPVLYPLDWPEAGLVTAITRNFRYPGIKDYNVQIPRYRVHR